MVSGGGEGLSLAHLFKLEGGGLKVRWKMSSGQSKGAMHAAACAVDSSLKRPSWSALSERKALRRAGIACDRTCKKLPLSHGLRRNCLTWCTGIRNACHELVMVHFYGPLWVVPLL